MVVAYRKFGLHGVQDALPMCYTWRCCKFWIFCGRRLDICTVGTVLVVGQDFIVACIILIHRSDRGRRLNPGCDTGPSRNVRKEPCNVLLSDFTLTVPIR